MFFTRFVRDRTWSRSLQLIVHIAMASIETQTVPRCRGCGVPMPHSSSGRRLLTGLSNKGMLIAWKSLLDEKLDELNLAVDGEVTGYICRKCFRAFQNFNNTKFKLMTGISEAVKYINTRLKEDPDDQYVEPAASIRSVLGKRKDRDPAQTSADLTTQKRPRACTQTDFPPQIGSSTSPDVQVGIYILGNKHAESHVTATS